MKFILKTGLQLREGERQFELTRELSDEEVLLEDV